MKSFPKPVDCLYTVFFLASIAHILIKENKYFSLYVRELKYKKYIKYLLVSLNIHMKSSPRKQPIGIKDELKITISCKRMSWDVVYYLGEKSSI